MQAFLSHILKHCATLVSGFGAQRKLFILIYHQVLDEPDFMRPGEVDKRAFAWQMALLEKYFNVLPMADALARLANGSLPPRAVVITFDDGYADNLHNAVPILKQYQLTATFFIASGFLNGGRMWNDSIIEAIRIMPNTVLDLSEIGLGEYPIATPIEKAKTASSLLKKLKHLPPSQRMAYCQMICAKVGQLPDDLMLTSAELIELHGHGMEIGGHTVNHPILAKLDGQAVAQEVGDNKAYLEGLLKAPIRYFAYPNGRLGEDYLPEHGGIVKQCGYLAAFSTHTKVADSSNDIWQLPRFTPWDDSPLWFMMRLVVYLFKTQK